MNHVLGSLNSQLSIRKARERLVTSTSSGRQGPQPVSQSSGTNSMQMVLEFGWNVGCPAGGQSEELEGCLMFAYTI